MESDRLSAKHGENTTLDDNLVELINSKENGGSLDCASAFRMAADTRTLPSEIGRHLDLLGIKITRCQLGLFGGGQSGKSIRPAKKVAEDLQEAIKSGARKKVLPCARVWSLAKQQKYSKMAVAEACEALKIKISPCQLGAF